MNTNTFDDFEWVVGEDLVNAAEAGLTMGYPIYARTPDGRKLIAVVRAGDLTDLANSKLLASGRDLLREVEYLLIDLQGVLAQYCDTNLHEAEELAPAASIALEKVALLDPAWEDPAAYALAYQDDEKDEDEEDATDGKDGEEEDEEDDSD